MSGGAWNLFQAIAYHLRRYDGSYTIGVCNDIDKKIYISEELYGELLKSHMSRVNTRGYVLL